MRKKRPDSKLAGLTEEQAAELSAIAARDGLARAAAWLGGTLKLDVHVSNVGRWLADRQRREHNARVLLDVRGAAEAAREIVRAADAQTLGPALKALLEQQALDALLAGKSAEDVKDAIEAGATIGHELLGKKKNELAAQKVGLDARRIVLLEKKAQQADAAKTVAGDQTLTAEEQRRRIKEIFGL